MIGLPGVGKTAYLYVVGRHADTATELGSWHIAETTADFDRFIVDCHRRLPNWEKTDPIALPACFDMFSLVRRRFSNRQRVRLRAFDSSGELWRQTFIPGEAEQAGRTGEGAQEARRALQKWAAGCGGFILLLDAHCPGSTAAEDAAQLRDLPLFVRLVFDSLARNGGAEDDVAQRPVAVVLNKGDVHAERLGLTDLINTRKGLTREGKTFAGSPELAYEQVKTETQGERGQRAAQFVEQYFPRLHAFLRRVPTWRCFAVSCWGHTPEVEGGRLKIDPDFCPVCVEEPLAWLADRVYRRARCHWWRMLARSAALLLGACLTFWIADTVCVRKAAATGNLPLGRGLLALLECHPLRLTPAALGGVWLEGSLAATRAALASADRRRAETATAAYRQGMSRLAANEPEAFGLLRQAAELGHAAAQYELGGAYENGRGVTANEPLAAGYYRQAADQGYAPAQCNLGACYANGVGVPKNETEAARWYRKAADQGLASAQLLLARCYGMGKGVLKDEPEMAHWYRKAADQGDLIAQDNLGVCYLEGRGVAKDEPIAAGWFRKAAEQGSASAQTHLGICLAFGQGVPKDEAEAVRWLSQAAERGDLDAQDRLGGCYLEGRGVRRDETKATHWFRQAADQGNPSAQTHLGACLAAGQGAPRDEAEAARWHRRAADQGYAPAQFQLAAAYEQGRGVAKDGRTALLWYRKAAKQGQPEAIRAEERLSKSL